MMVELGEKKPLAIKFWLLSMIYQKLLEDTLCYIEAWCISYSASVWLEKKPFSAS